MPRPRARAVIVATVAALVIPAAAMAITWSLPAADISTEGATDGVPTSVTGADGVTTALWYFGSPGVPTVYAAVRPRPGAAFLPPAQISSPGSWSYVPLGGGLAVAPDGATTAVWWELQSGPRTAVKAATRAAGATSFSAPVTVAIEDDYTAATSIAIGRDGATTVAWQVLAAGAVRVASRAPGATAFGPATTIVTGVDTADTTAVGIAADGTTTVMWNEVVGGFEQVKAAVRPAGSASFGPPQALSAQGLQAVYPVMAVTPDGRATVVWNVATNSEVQTATRAAGASDFGPAVTLSTTPAPTLPRVAAGENGATSVVWSQSVGNTAGQVMLATQAPGATAFGAAEPVSPLLGLEPQQDVAMAPDGATTVLWRSESEADVVVNAATRPAGATVFGPVSTLSAAGVRATGPRLSVSPTGAATTTWLRTLGNPTPYVVQAVSSDGTNYGLAVTHAGTGTGTVTSAPAGMNCTTTCTAQFPLSSRVTLTATAATGSRFTGWSGEGCSGTGTCAVTMMGARAVTATFAGPTVKVRGATALSSGRRVIIRSRVTTSGAGRITQRGTARIGGRAATVCRATRTVERGGTAVMTCRVTTRRAAPMRVSLRTTYTPTDQPSVATTTVVRVPARAIRRAVTG